MFNIFLSPLEKGIRLMKRESYAEAIRHFSRLIERGVSPAESRFNLGKCFFKLRRFRDAKEYLLRVLDYPLTPELSSGILEMTNWRRLCSSDWFNSWPAFSPDGSRLAFVSARRDTNGDGKLNAHDRGGIYLLELPEGGERCLADDSSFNSMPAFSPDGRKLAYLSVRSAPGSQDPDPNANPALHLQDLETGEETQLLDDQSRIKYITFSADGGTLYFSCWHPGNRNCGIYALELGTGRTRTLISGLHENTFPSVSPLGDRLVYASWRRDTNADGVIDLRDNTGVYLKNLVSGSEVAVAADEYNSSFPVFSPDGEKIAFLSVRRDTNGDGRIDTVDNAGIYLYDCVRRRERCLVDDRHFNKYPCFTPDGTRIVFLSSWRRNGASRERRDFFENKGIYTVDLRDRSVKRLVSDKYFGSRSPVVSPKGDLVAYVSWREDTNRGLYLAYLDRSPCREELSRWIADNL